MESKNVLAVVIPQEYPFVFFDSTRYTFHQVIELVSEAYQTAIEALDGQPPTIKELETFMHIPFLIEMTNKIIYDNYRIEFDMMGITERLREWYETGEFRNGTDLLSHWMGEGNPMTLDQHLIPFIVQDIRYAMKYLNFFYLELKVSVAAQSYFKRNGYNILADGAIEKVINDPVVEVW